MVQNGGSPTIKIKLYFVQGFICCVLAVLVMSVNWCPIVSEQLSTQYGAVKMLHSRVRLVLDYLKAVQSGDSNNLTLEVLIKRKCQFT